MILKLENSEIVINGKKVFRTIIGACIAIKLCKSIFKSKKNYYITINNDSKKTKEKK